LEKVYYNKTDRLISLALKVVDPRRKSLGGDGHAAGLRKVWLRIVLDLHVDNLARLK
jgi:hypothetical protein